MAEFKLKGNTFHTVGDLPAVGAEAPAARRAPIWTVTIG